MAPAAKRSRAVFIEISSSTEEEGGSETDRAGGEEEEEEEDDDDDTDEEVSGASSSELESSGSSDIEADDDADYVADEDDEEGEELDEKDEESEDEEEEEDDRGKRTNITCGGRNKHSAIRNEGDAYDNIVNLLQRGKSLGGLKHEECKSYLREHSLRISGTKAICIQRIQEHWRIKGGKGENIYPRSSFTINCTGDVCKGDVVLFKQKVFEKFDKVTRGGGANVIGKRTIAGRIVKESYGAAKQQHTFTVEILWSKGVKALPALFPLLVKGRNLYRLKTFRQPWKNENERVKVLHEKHKRGAAARQARAAAKARYGPKLKGTASSVRPAKQRKKNPKPSKAVVRKEQRNRNDTSKPQDSHASIRISEPCKAPELSHTYLRPNTQPTAYHGSFASNHQNLVLNDPRQVPGGRSFFSNQLFGCLSAWSFETPLLSASRGVSATSPSFFDDISCANGKPASLFISWMPGTCNPWLRGLFLLEMLQNNREIVLSTQVKFIDLIVHCFNQEGSSNFFFHSIISQAVKEI